MPAKKPSKFMTNSEEIKKRLQKKCDGGHEHQHLLGGSAKKAVGYPVKMCDLICEAREAAKAERC